MNASRIALLAACSLSPLATADVITITTGQTGGADAHIQSDSTPDNNSNQSGQNFGSAGNMLVKYDTGDGTMNEGRKLYLRFSLNAPEPDVVPSQIAGATLSITLATAHNASAFTYRLWGLNDGFAGVDKSTTPDGDTVDDEDIHGENWSESLIDWASAPANFIQTTTTNNAAFATQSKGFTSDATLLGQFTIAGSTAAGTTIVINSFGTPLTGGTQSLVDFLKSDTNGLVTFMIARETSNSAISEFASDEHATFDPPTLAITIPEPATLALSVLGLGLLLPRRRAGA